MRIRLLFFTMCILSLSICRGQYTHYFWFDNRFDDVVTMTGERLTADLDIGELKDGIHTIRHYAQTADGSVTNPCSAIFLKTSMIEGTQPVYCSVRIDNSITKEIQSEINDGLVHLNIDMSDITDGFHQISAQLMTVGGNTVLSTTTSYFIKDASIGDGAEIDCHAIIDNRIQQTVRCVPTDGVLHFDLDMHNITNGVHQVTMYLVPVGSTTVIDPMMAFFVKMPVDGSRISRYCYWFDNNSNEMVSCECSQEQSAIEFIGLIEANLLPFRSSSYEFGIDGDNIVLTSMHDFNFMAMDNNGRFSNTRTKTYSDTRSQRIIPVDGIENLSSCSNKRLGVIEENDIKLYKFYAEVGDSLSLQLSNAASFELYSPKGETVLERKGRLSESVSTVVLVETGMYYLAIHDIVGRDKNNEMITFNHVPRNAILNVNPAVISTPGQLFSMELFGNGFSNARKLILRNDVGACYEVDSLYALDNYHLVVAVEHDSDIQYGDYHLSLIVDDQVSEKEVTIQYPHSVKISARHDIAKIAVDVIPSKKASTPYMVDVKVTNDSDVPCWGIPFNVACELSDKDDDEQISYEFFMKDFFGQDISLERFKWHETDNLLGTETRGVLLPMTIAYLNPHETRVLRIGIRSEAHQKVGIYAWTGEPYSEAADRFLNMSQDEMENMTIYTSNMFSFETYSYLLWVIEELTAKLDSGQSRLLKAASSDNDWVLQYIADYIPDLLERSVQGTNLPIRYAKRNVAVYTALGKVIAGIINCESNYQSYHFFKYQRGIPGDNISEQLAYLYSHNMMNTNDDGLNYHIKQVTENMAKTVSPEEIMAELERELADNPIPEPICDAVCDYYSNQQAQNPDPQPKRHKIESLQAWDPNDISGPTDFNDGPYIGIDVSRLQYKIEFENDPTMANAPASFVKVENNLDGSVFDLSSYKPLAVRIGNRNVKLPEGKSFVTTVDMRPDINCILEIRHDYNEMSGESVWTFNSLDPVSIENVDDSQQGFLPVNDSNGIGVGEIEYSIDIRTDLRHNTELRNKANIIFDDNEAIETTEWVNVTDYVRPTGKIISMAVSSDGRSYVFNVDCADEGAGVYSHDLCAKTKDSDKWIVVKPDITDSTVELEFSEPVYNLEFAVRATDIAGNQQLLIDESAAGIEGVIEATVNDGGQNELWYNIKGQRVDKSKTVNTPIISNTGKRIINLR